MLILLSEGNSEINYVGFQINCMVNSKVKQVTNFLLR